MQGDMDTGGALTRRLFFERLAAVGGLGLAMAGMEALGFGFSSAMAAPPKLTGGAKGTKVVIIGAGHAGMTSAYELEKAGYKVEVLEPRDIVGGRCQTARKGVTQTDLLGNTQVCDFDEGQYINCGPWRIPYHHLSTLHYTKLFGVQLESFVNDNDASYVYFDKQAKGPLAGKPIRKGQIAADARGYTAEIVAKAASKGNLDAFISAEDKEKFIAYVINEGYLNKKDFAYTGTDGRGYTTLPGAGVDPGPGVVAKPFAFHDVLDSNMWFLLNSVTEFDQQRTMFQPVGGMDHIAMGFGRAAGHLVKFGSTVKKVEQGPSGVTVNYVDKAGQPHTTTADYCICTIPISVLKNIDMGFSAPFKDAMTKVSYTPVNKIGLQMKRRFWEEDHMIYGGHVFLDDPAINLISLPSTNWQGQKGTLLGYYAFGADAIKVSAKKPAERTALALAAGQKVFPEYTASCEKSFSKSWHLDEHNLGGWAEWSPESRASAYPVLCQPEGRIYLAGEHLSYIGGWQAGAIESAWQQIERLHARVQKA